MHILCREPNKRMNEQVQVTEIDFVVERELFLVIRLVPWDSKKLISRSFLCLLIGCSYFKKRRSMLLNSVFNGPHPLFISIVPSLEFLLVSN